MLRAKKGYGYGGIKQSRLRVEKVFKGNLKVGQELIFAQGGGADCIWTFGEESVGQEVLFYLGDKPLSGKAAGKVIAATTFGNLAPEQGVWAAFTCSRSGGVKYRTGDVKYLENVSKVRGKTRLSGVLSQYTAAAIEGEESKYDLLSNRKIKIAGVGKNLELTTDENGFYEIYDLPAGKYTLTPEKIDGYKFYRQGETSVEVVIKPKGHAEQDFNYEIDNRISGKFYDANGQTLKDVCIHLLPARGAKAQYFYQGDCTNEKGEFKFEEIPAGTYVIVINDDGKISADEPFGTFYYPSALKPEDAAEISIGAGEFRSDLKIVAPTTAETITVSGVWSYEDGKPVADESVEFFNGAAKASDLEKYKTPDSREATDKTGRFTIRILKGQKGILLGEMNAFTGEYLSCPKLDKIIRATGEEIPEIKTQSVSIDAAKNLNGVRLKFPFPGCRKAKID